MQFGMETLDFLLGEPKLSFQVTPVQGKINSPEENSD